MRKILGTEFHGAAQTSRIKPKCSLNWHQFCLALGVHFKLSVGRTAATVLGAIGAAAAIRKGGGGGGGAAQ
jgi:hypothetical protein